MADKPETPPLEPPMISRVDRFTWKHEDLVFLTDTRNEETLRQPTWWGRVRNIVQRIYR